VQDEEDGGARDCALGGDSPILPAVDRRRPYADENVFTSLAADAAPAGRASSSPPQERRVVAVPPVIATSPHRHVSCYDGSDRGACPASSSCAWGWCS
jgi:hypothetical protein